MGIVGEPAGTFTLDPPSRPFRAEGLAVLLSPEALLAASLDGGALVALSKTPEPAPGELYLARVWPSPKMRWGRAEVPARSLGAFEAGREIWLWKLREPANVLPELPCLELALEGVSEPDLPSSLSSQAVTRTPIAGRGRATQVLSPSMRGGVRRGAASPATPLPAPYRVEPSARDATIETLVKALQSGSSSRLRCLLERSLAGVLRGWVPLPGNLVTIPFMGKSMRLAVTGDVGGSASFGLSTRITLRLGGNAPAADPVRAAVAAVEAATADLGEAARAPALRALERGRRGLDARPGQVGGYEQQLRALRDLVVVPAREPALFPSLGLEPPRGVLLHGPPGSGKTLLACVAAAEASCHLLVVDGAEVLGEYVGETEAALVGIFAAARALAPSIVFFDELDALASATGASGSRSGAASRAISVLVAGIDGLRGHAVSLLAGTNRVEAIDPALRRPGRFDREIEISGASPADREAILRTKLAGLRHMLSEEEVAAVARGAHGFVGADLGELCNEAALEALRRTLRAEEPTSSASLTSADFATARRVVGPSALRDFVLEVPSVRWDDIGGNDLVKARLREVVELPFTRRSDLERLNVTPPQGILLHGPPGCSKTMLARAVAGEAKLNFISIKGSELYSKFVGESEKAVSRLFARARSVAPTVIFFDEIDGLASERSADGAAGVSVSERVVSQLLQEMDGLAGRGGVIVVAATNRLDSVDPALLRPGRFDRLVLVPLPDEPGRRAIFRVHTRGMPLTADVKLVELAALTEGRSGADIENLCREAGLAALAEDDVAVAVGMRHFHEALALA